MKRLSIKVLLILFLISSSSYLLFSQNLPDISGAELLEKVKNKSSQKNADLYISLLYKRNVKCYGECNGAIAIQVNDAAPDFDIYWLNGYGTVIRWVNVPSGTTYIDSITNICVDTYNIIVEDFDGDLTSLDVAISSPAAMFLSSITTTKPLCFGDCNGKIKVNLVVGGVPPRTFLWNDGVTGNTDTALCVGPHSVTVTDANGCKVDSTFQLTQPPLLTVVYDSSNITCKGLNNGTISLTINGGTLPYSFLWADGPVSEDRIGLSPGTYTVTVKDANNCSWSKEFTITEPDQNLNLSIAAFTDPTCPGLNNGTITATGSGGTRPYTFAWSFGGPYNPDSVATGLTAGTYSVTITDDNGCSAPPASQTLTNPPLPVATASNNGPKCVGASLTLSSSGGDTYHWNGPDGFDSFIQNPVINPVTEAANGTYTVTVTNTATNCSSTATTDVIINALPTVSANSNSPVCVGADINLTSSGGMNYSWSGPSFASGTQNPTIPNAALSNAGVYTVTVTDVNNCQNTATTTVVVNTLPNASAGNNGPICAEQTLNLTANGGTNYIWEGPGAPAFSSVQQNPSIPNATVANTGTYSVTVTDANNCSATATTNVTVNALPTATAGSNSPLCVGQTLNLTAGGGTSYSWSGPPAGSYSSAQQNPSITNVTTANAGTYTVIVTASGCSKTVTTDVVINSLPTATAGSNSPLCVGQTLNLTSGGGTNYSWSGPPAGTYSSNQQNPSIANVTTTNAGTYTVTVTDGNNCSSTATTTVVINSLPTATAGSNSPLCEGQTLNLTSGGGTNYAWSGPPAGSYSSAQQNPSITNVTTTNAGTYTVTVTDGNNCSSTATTTVVINSLPTATAGSNSPLCVGQTLNLTSGGGTNYAWSGPPANSYSSAQQNPSIANVTTANAGTYTVTVTDGNNCSATATTTVVINSLPTPTAGSNSPLCVGQTLNLTSGGGTNYAWSGPPAGSYSSNQQNPNIINVTTANAGTYTVTVTDGNNCSSTATTTVVINSLPTATAGSNSPLCVGQTLNLTSGGGTNYAWSGPPAGSYSSVQQNPSITNISIANAGTYTVTVTDGNNCSATASTLVVINSLPTATTGSNSPLCEGQTLNLASGGGTNYSWSGPPANTYSSTQQNPSIINVTTVNAGVYTVTVTDGNNCSATATTTVVINPLPTATAGSNSPLCVGQTLNLTSSGGTNYSWSGPPAGSYSSAQQNPTIINVTTANAGIYTVTVTDGNNCSKTATTTVVINALPTATAGNNGPICEGETLNLTSGGGTNYAWSGPPADSYSSNEQNPSITNVTTTNAGTYTVTVTNANNCSATATTTVTINPAPVATASSNSPVCAGDPINLTSSGGGTYSWSSTSVTPFTSAQQNPIINNATSDNAGTYTVTVTLNGCSATASTTVAVTVVSLTNQTTTDVSNCATPNGTLTVTAAGGSIPYTYSISNPNPPPPVLSNQTGVFTGLPAATYTVTITDFFGCEVIGTPISINTIPPINCNPIVTNISPCFTSNNGSITFNCAGGALPIWYKISPTDSNTTGIFTNLTPGTYTPIVRDANQCQVTLTPIDITAPPQLVAEICDSIMSCGSLPTVVSGTTFLPDGAGGSYSTTITHNDFSPTAFITSANDIEAICASIEHSYAGDLEINIICPNLQTANLKAAFSGGNKTLGEPIMVNHPDEASLSILDPGVGYTYCWETNSSYTMGGSPQAYHDYTDALGTYHAGIPFLPAGSYNPEGSLSNLIGCPLNGNWTIQVTDHMNMDNGYIFWWRLDFKPSLFPDEYCGGSATVCPNGGNGTYSFLWSNGETTNMIDSLCAETYSVVITDGVGCTATDTVTITNVDISTDVAFNPVLCNGDFTDAWVIANGSSGFSYEWSTTSTNDTIFNVPTGTYYVTVEDLNGCHGYDTLSIAPPNPLIITSVTIIPPVLCMNDTSTITIVASGGTGQLSYSYGSGPGETNTTGIFHGMPPATYSFTVTDINGCHQDTTFTINNPPGISITNQSFTNASCYGICDGTITITANGGTLPLSYSVNGGTTWAGSGNFTNLCANTYQIVVKDNNGCFVNGTPIIITQPAEIAITSQNFQNITSCYNDCNGSITVTASGGVNPITYNMGGTLSNTTGIFTNLCAGNYSMTITDNSLNHCPATGSPLSFTLTQPTQITATSTSSSANNKCFGQCNGTIAITASGGTGVLSYSTNGGTTWVGSGTIASLCANTYTLSVKDENGCTITPTPGTATITTPPELKIDSITNTPYPCNGDTMSVTIYASGGTPNYLYEIDNSGAPAMPNIFHGVQAGTHTLSVIDFKFCRKDSAWTAPVAVPLSVAITAQTDPLCHNGTNGNMTATVSGGTPPFDYTWSTGTTINDSPVLTNTQNSLSPGTISVTVTDSSNPACVVSTSALLNNPDTIEITKVVVQPGCGSSDGEINITVTGGTGIFSYLWENNSTNEDRNGLGAGTFIVTATDANGCTQTDQTLLSNPNAPIVTFSNIIHNACNGQNSGSAIVEANGGTPAYSDPVWDGPGTFVYTGWNGSGLAAGDYNVTVTDAANCQGIGALTITEGNLIVIQSFDSTNISCFGLSDGTVTVTASGGTGNLDFTLNGNTQVGSGSFTGLAANTYTLTIEDDSNCSITRDVTLTEPADILIDTQTSQNITCHDYDNGTVTVSASGGAGSFWYFISTNTVDSNQTGSFTSLAEGNYTVTIEDANSCSKTTNILPVVNPAGIAVTEDIINPNCGLCDGSITVHTTGGVPPYTFEWLVGSSTDSIATNLCAGSPEIVITDFNGCKDTIEYALTNPAAGTIYFNQIATLTCFGDTTASLEVNMDGGTVPFTYTWDVASHHLIGNPLTDTLAVNLGAGTYSVTVTDGNNCVTIKDTTITNPSDILVTGVTKTDITCHGLNNGTISVSATSGTSTLNYCLNPGPICETSGNFTSLIAGTYFITITNDVGCQKITNAVTITEPDTIEVNISSQNSNCGLNNGMAQVAAIGGSGTFTYNWYDLGNNPNTIVTNIAPGTYHVSVTDNVYGCAVVSGVTIEDIAPGTLTFVNITNNSCPDYTNGTATATVIGGNHPMALWLWSNGAIDSTLTNLTCGWYKLTVTDALGCIKIDSIEIACPPEIQISTIDTNINCFGATTGSITATAIGGNGGFTYTLDVASNSNGYFAGLNAGEYIISVSDALGCTMSDTTTLIQSSEIFASPTIIFPNCGQSNGSISLNVTGGNPDYDYSWLWSAGTSTDAALTNLHADTYNLTITDSKNCTKDTFINVINPDAGVLSFNPVIHNQCFGFCNGSATAVMTGGVPPYTFTWSNGVTGQTISGLCSGTYTVSVVDFNGCFTQGNIEITSPPQIFIDASVSTSIYCNGDLGAISATASGGSGLFSYSIVNPVWQSTGLFENLVANTYIITAKDSNQCTISSNPINLTQPAAITLNETFTDITCNNSNNGIINVVAGGGTNPFLYQFSGSTSWSATGTYSNLSEGSYYVIVADANGCRDTSSTFNITNPSLLSLTTSSINSSCLNADGQASVTANGGSPDYSYLWPYNGNTTNTLSNVGAGCYTVIVTDTRGCVDSSIVCFSDNGPGTLNFTNIVPLDCYGINNGQATVILSGATASTYDWTSGETTATATQLWVGENGVEVVDNFGCIYSSLVNIPGPDSIHIEITSQNIDCNGANNGIISFSLVTGGTPAYQYSINNGSTFQASHNFTGLSAGTYQTMVKDAKNCLKAGPIVVITQPAAIVLSAATITNNACFGDCNGSISITASGGVAPYQFTINGFDVFPAGIFNSLCAGNYNVSVTDMNNCQKISPLISLLENPQITMSFQIDTPTCGYSDGTVQVIANGGLPSVINGYSYAWGESAGYSISQSIINLTSGAYSVTVTDSLNCSVEGIAALSDSGVGIISIDTLVHNPCFGNSIGWAVATITGGTPDYAFTWSSGATQASSSLVTDTAYNFAAGNHWVKVTDDAGCSTTEAFSITQPQQIQLQLTEVNDVNCFGNADGGIEVSATGGTPGYAFTIGTETNLSGVFANLPIGTYSVLVADTNNCQKTRTGIVIDEPEAMVITAATDSSNCNLSDGRAVAIITYGGTFPYEFLWDANAGNQTTQTAINLSNGVYSYTVTDAHGCTNSAFAIVSDKGTPELSFTNVIGVNCSGNCTGTATVVVTGGVPTFSFAWDNLQQVPTATDLCGGIHFITVTDGNGCNVIDSVTIAAPQPISINPVLTHINCYGLSTGAIELNATGGTPPLTYAIDGSAFSENGGIFTNLPAGTHITTIRDLTLCERSDTLEILQAPQIVLDIVTDSSTCGFNDGIITVHVTGGTPYDTGYVYTWNPSIANDSVATGLGSGIYHVTITDSLLCQVSATVPLSDEGAGLLTIDPVEHNKCNGDTNGLLFATVTGIPGSISYLWTDNNGSTISTTQLANNLPAGIYLLQITDESNCHLFSQDTITEPNPIALSGFSSDVLCYGENTGFISVSATGGTPDYIYLLGNDTSYIGIFNNLLAGTYNVTVIDANNCQRLSGATIISQPPQLIANATSTNSNCNLSIGTATVAITGGTGNTTIVWSDPAGQTTNTATGLAADIYYVTVTDANSCFAIDTAYVTDVDAGTIAFDPVTHVLCHGDSTGNATAIITGGIPIYSFEWMNGDILATADSLWAGVHWVKVTDAAGCISIDTVLITEPDAIHFDTLSVTDANCYGSEDGKVFAIVSGGTQPYTFTVNGATYTDINFEDVPAGNYIIEVTDANSCKENLDVLVGQPSDIVLTGTTDSSACNGNDGIATVIAEGGVPGYSYLWSDGQTNSVAYNLPAGVYVVTVSDSHSCQDTLIVFIDNENGPILSVDNVTHNPCFGDSSGQIVVTANGGTPGYNFTWNTNPVQTTGTASNLPAGYYYVEVADAAGCITHADTTIFEPEELLIAYSDTAPSCNGISDGSLVITANGGTLPYEYTLNTTTQSTGIFTQLSEGLYTIIVNDGNNCQKTFNNVPVTAPTPITITATAINPTCAQNTYDGSISLSVQGGTPGYTFLWSNNATSQNLINLQGGTYIVTVTDQKNCSKVDTNVIAGQIEVYADAGADTLVCHGDSIMLNANGGTSYLWSPSNYLNSDTSATPYASPAATTEFILMAFIGNCYDSDTVQVTVLPKAEINAGPDVVLLHGYTTTLQAVCDVPGTTFQWLPGEWLSDPTILNPVVSPDATTTFYLYATSPNGCVAKDSVNIKVIPVIQFTEGFSPNDDGINDVWTIRYFEYYSDIEVSIYNRWGEMLFHNKNCTEFWNGKYKGKHLPVGSYYYVITYVSPEGRQVLTGPVTIVR